MYPDFSQLPVAGGPDWIFGHYSFQFFKGLISWSVENRTGKGDSQKRKGFLLDCKHFVSNTTICMPSWESKFNSIYCNRKRFELFRNNDVLRREMSFCCSTVTAQDYCNKEKVNFSSNIVITSRCNYFFRLNFLCLRR